MFWLSRHPPVSHPNDPQRVAPLSQAQTATILRLSLDPMFLNEDAVDHLRLGVGSWDGGFCESSFEDRRARGSGKNFSIIHK